MDVYLLNSFKRVSRKNEKIYYFVTLMFNDTTCEIIVNENTYNYILATYHQFDLIDESDYKLTPFVSTDKESGRRYLNFRFTFNLN